MEPDDTSSSKVSPTVHLSSPHLTPGSHSHTRFPPQTSHTSPLYKRMGFTTFAQAPPLEFIEPIGQGHQFRFTRPQDQSRDDSSWPSTASSQAVTSDEGSDEESDQEKVRPVRIVEHAHFVLEKLASDAGYDNDIEVLRPSGYEDATSDAEEKHIEENERLLKSFEELRCDVDSSDDENERIRIYRRKKKRWSAGVFLKRTRSSSIEGDNSYSDNDPLVDVDTSARRLRRRLRGPGDRSSLIFEDKGFANDNNIVESSEPDDGGVSHSKGPPSIPSDDGFTLDEMPFWLQEDLIMEIESGSSFGKSAKDLKSVPEQFGKTSTNWNLLKQEDKESFAEFNSPAPGVPIIVQQVSVDRFPEWVEILLRKEAEHAGRSMPRSHSDLVDAPIFSPDGRLVAVTSNNNIVLLYNAVTRSCSMLQAHLGLIRALAFSPNNNLLALAYWNGAITLWDVRWAVSRHTLEGHSSLVETVDFSRDGKFLASISDDRIAMLWDTASGSLLQAFFIPETEEQDISSDGFQESFAQKELAIAQFAGKEQQSGSDKASTFGGTTIGSLESHFTGDTLAHSNTNKAINEDFAPKNSISEQEGYDDDIRSLLSEDGNESQAPIRSSGRGKEIENAIVSVLATNPVLTPLYEKALELMPEERFINNLRRLLKVFHDDLANIGGNLVTQELAAILKRKAVRERIARKVTGRQISAQTLQAEEDLARFQEPDTSNFSYLEGWLAKGKFPPLDTLENPDIDRQEGLIHNKDIKDEEQSTHDEGESNDGSESDEEESYEIEPSKPSELARFPRLDTVIQALVEGRPFQDMLIGLKEFLLPYGLLNEILPIPREHITFDSRDKYAVVNNIQKFLEDITSLEWDWWPLSPRMDPLNNDEVRVYWQCFCGTVRWRKLRSGQRVILEDLLEQRPTKSLYPPFCSSLKRSSTDHGLHIKAQQGSTQTSGQMPGSISTAQKKYTPTNEGFRSSENSVSGPVSDSSSNPMQSASEVSSARDVLTQNSSRLNKHLRVIFGVEGPRITLELDQIRDDDLQSDLLFLRKLRRRHRQLRGSLRAYFSFWRLSYWDFVKFERIPLQPGRVLVQKVDLPDSNEYEYAPRPPDVTAEHPGISRHEFEIIVQMCITPCRFASLPILHDCLSIEESATHIVGRLPKKNKEFMVYERNPRDRYFWGIQARYVVSAIRVVTIHVFILCVSFGTWIWWQWKHPDDLQGASVGLTVAGVLMSTFWSSTGVLKGLR